VASPTARSLVLDLLSTLREGAMPVRALIAAAELFGIAENNVRVALARLRAAGLIERDDRGQYRLGVPAEAVNRQVASWRSDEARVRRWEGGWIGVHVGGLPRADRRRLRRRTRALRFLGFRELGPGLDVRPDNLAAGIPAVRARLGALGLDPEAPVFAMGALDASTEARARGLWDAAALRASYREARNALAESEARLGTRTAAEAMVESFTLGGRVIRQIVLDPLLPEPIVPAAERAAVVAAMRRYDRAGRACWAPLLRAFGVPHLHAPADLRLVVAGERGAVSAGGGVA
jgi:phenylacetic acid degradation operon negative regulatory protein